MIECLHLYLMKGIGNYLVEKVTLGQGQYGTVSRCHLKTDTKKVYAVKVINKQKLDSKLFNYLKNEIDLLAKINSPHVIKLIDIQRTQHNFYLIMEYCNGGDLEKLKMVKKRFTENEARVILQ